MHYGPAHIVWDDENFGRESVQWCLDHFDEYVWDETPEERAAVRQSLQDLLTLPDDVRDPFGELEDIDDPKTFPDPPKGVVFVRR